MIVGELSPLATEGCRSVLDLIPILLGTSQKEFASNLKVSSGAIYRWKTGTRQVRFSIEQILILQQMLHSIGLDFEDFPKNWSDSISMEELQSCLRHIQQKINQLEEAKIQRREDLQSIY